MKDFLKHFFIPHQSNDYKPHFLREGAVLVIGVAAITLFFSSLSSSTILQKSNNMAAVYSAVLIDLTNEARVSNNESRLVKSDVLERAAQMKADDMAANGYFAHTSPAGVTPWYWFKQAGYRFSYAGENLAIDFKDSTDIEKAWLNSPGHRANILSDDFTEIGIAVKEGIYKGHKTIYVVQMFGKPKVAAIAAATPSPIASSNTASAISMAPSVMGDSTNEAEQPVSVVREDESIIVVKEFNPSPLPALAEVAMPEVSSSPMPAPVHYTSWYERMLLNQPHVVDYALKVISLIVIFALVVYIFIEIKTQHKQQIIYGVLLLILVLSLSYYNHTFMITKTPIFSSIQQ